MAIRSASPPYIVALGIAWRIVIPVAGKLAPVVPPERFETRAAAREWLTSADGKDALKRAALSARGKGRPLAAVRADDRPAA